MPDLPLAPPLLLRTFSATSKLILIIHAYPRIGRSSAMCCIACRAPTANELNSIFDAHFQHFLPETPRPS